MSWFTKSKQNVKITAAMAADRVAANKKAVNEGAHRQRPIIESNKRRLKAAMLRGAFINNGDPIIFDENGFILEGQHRLESCAETGVTIECDVVVKQSVINGIRTIETYGSTPRSMGIKFLLADGMKNYKIMAALAGMFAIIAGNGSKAPALDVGQSRMLLETFGDSIQDVLDATGCGQSERRAWFLGPVIWACKIDKQKALDFAHKFVTMENVPKGDPTIALRVWISNHGNLGGAAGRFDMLNAACSALRNHFDGAKIQNLRPSPAARDWLLSQTKSTTRKVLEIVNPPDILKLAA